MSNAVALSLGSVATTHPHLNTQHPLSKSKPAGGLFQKPI